MNDKRIIAGVDIGGTNIRCAIADAQEPTKLLARGRVRTPALDPPLLADLIRDQIRECLIEAGLERDQLVSVGCAAAGITDAGAGLIVSAANLPGWRNVPLAQLLADRIRARATIENDVRAAALGEFRFGAGRDRRSLIYMTISTGVSAGIVINGTILRGRHNFAGEIAYLLSEPAHIGKDWGINGCLELTAAGVGIAREWTELSGNTASAEDVFAAAREGNKNAERIVARAGDYLGQAAVALCTIIDPEILVLGGGIAENEPPLVERIKQVVASTLPYPPEIVTAALGTDSPLVGALTLAVERSL